jgi:hypothetical protein
MFKLFKKKDPIVELWNWFEANRTLYENMPDAELGENLDVLYQRVIAISPGLAVEMSRMNDGVRDLVISANGDVSLFPTVEATVAAAPKFERWTVTAFRPRIPETSVLKADNLELDMKKMFFVTAGDDGELEVHIFVEDIKDNDPRQVFAMGMIIIDNLLGEYDSATKVKAYGFHDLEEAHEDWSLTPLVELPGTVDAFHQRSNN